MFNKKKKMQLMPLRGVIVFPHMVIHLDVGREKSIKALEKAMVGDSNIFLVSQRDAQTDEPEVGDLYKVGTISKVKQMIKLPGGNFRVLVEGVQRAKLNKLIYEDPYFEVEIEPIREEEEESGESPELEALMRTLQERFDEYVQGSKKISPEAVENVSGIEDPGEVADIITSHLPINVEQKQEILETVNLRKRMERLAEILNRELEILEIEKKISSRVRKQMEKTQKEYYLREQMKAIQQELGEKDERMAEADEYRKKVSEAELPEEVEEKALKELDRLEKMPMAAAESVVIRNYLDWLVELPWSHMTEDQLDLDVVQEVLDEDHYGLEEVKERIIEFLAVRRLSTEAKGPILCLVGPPGVGKTSLARSVARAMNRNFARISLGGVRDEAEIRGHRRTYVGALPGRIIQGMRKAESKNPVFLLDEIDKMSVDFRGDPSSALLEVLDPEQNTIYSDHFIEIPYDLSRVLFFTTANLKFNIPQTLLDRLEIINIPGYTEEEKVEIARRHLIPKQLKENGLTEDNISISEGALRNIIREYTREAGVRNLERNLSAVCRKVAREVVKDESYYQRVTKQNLQKFLGVPKYRFGVAEKEHQLGVATGLAWTEAGGDILSVEATLMKGKGKLNLTGKLGDVMQESAQAALSFIRSRTESLKIDEDFYEKFDMHVHIPEGAIPKDGPSAGVAMVIAMVSALTRRPVSKDYALTGEVTLRGRVLPVGGIKEKILAAHRAGIKKVILPADNNKDLSEVPSHVRRKIECITVEHMDEVINKVLLNREKQEDHMEGEMVGQEEEISTSLNQEDSAYRH